MTDLADRFRDTMRAVALDRQRGDALRKARRDAEADKLYEKAIYRIEKLRAESDNGQGLSRSDYAELLGVRGGLLKRRNQLGMALDSYRLGAEVERSGHLASTYNRINAIKLSLLSKQRTVVELHDQLLEAEATLSERLKKDPVAASDAWLWADLGDVRILLGNETDAVEAYKLFSQKATTGSPRRTLFMLDDIAALLSSSEDASSEEIALAIRRAKALLMQ
jgi:tetratricopeptide (TPR) repeat protein